MSKYLLVGILVLGSLRGLWWLYASAWNVTFGNVFTATILGMFFWIVYDIGKHNEHERLKARALELMRKKQEDDSHLIES